MSQKENDPMYERERASFDLRNEFEVVIDAFKVIREKAISKQQLLLNIEPPSRVINAQQKFTIMSEDVRAK